MPRLAVLGHPVSHSRSPAMHGAALAELGLAPEWTYEAIDVAPERFAERVRAMPAEGFVGANVTVPHKLAALELADEATRAAREIGAANTLSLGGGRIAAENTDAPGLLAALPAPPAGARALVLGAGGAARAAVWALREGRAEVAIWNRTAERAAALAAELGGEAVRGGDGTIDLRGFDLLVNTTSVGMSARSADPAHLKALPIDADGIRERHVVVDLAYGTADTALIAAARGSGATVVDGLEVLVRQGAASLAIWTGRQVPLDTMRKAARAR